MSSFGYRRQKSSGTGVGGGGGSESPAVMLRNDVSVLVVDDNRVNRRVLTKMLDWASMRAVEVENGKEAVELHVAGVTFDLIFMDMEMPVMDGPQATRILRQMGVHSRMVGVSGNRRESDCQAFIAAGLDEFYVKPLSRQTLVEILHRVDQDITNRC